MENLSLDTRVGLPDALRVLLADYPRLGWESHPNFTGLVQFWLERHMMFRRLCDMMQDDAQVALDRQMDHRTYAPRLARFGGMLVNQLHGHHQIEDAHYFPTLVTLDTRLERGFEILDKDHHDLGDLLDRFTQKANAVLRSDEAGSIDAIAKFAKERDDFAVFLARHLEDEEDLIVPIILKNDGAGLG